MSLNSPLGATQSGALPLTRDALALRSSRSRAGQFALGGLLLVGAVIAVSAAKTDLLLPETVRPVPGWLAGVFGEAGVPLGTAGAAVLMALMFGAYAVAATTADRLSARAVLATVAALHALVLLAPPLLSTDVFSYQAYGRMFAVYHANPYLHGPGAIQFDPVYPFIGQKWVGTPTAYGPLFTAISALLAPLSLASSVIAYKGLATLASLAVVALVWNIARLRGIDPIKAVAIVGLNPLVVLYGIGGGHNDLLMLAVMLFAVRFLLTYRDRAGGASLAVAAAIKLTSALLGPFALAGMAGRLARRRGRAREFLLGAGVTAVALAVLSLALFGTGSLHLLATLQHNQSHGDWHSIPGFISTRLGFGTIGHATGIVLGVVFAGVFAWLLRRVWRGEMDWIDGAAWATAAMLATASSLLPWYVAWLLPLAALARHPRLPRVAIAMSGLVIVIEIVADALHGAAVLGL